MIPSSTSNSPPGTLKIQNQISKSTVFLIHSWCLSMRLKLKASNTEILWFTRRTKNDNDLDHCKLAVQIDKDCCIQPSDVVRDLPVSRQHTVNDQTHLLGHQILLLPSTTNLPNKTLRLNEKCLAYIRTLNCSSTMSYPDLTTATQLENPIPNHIFEFSRSRIKFSKE